MAGKQSAKLTSGSGESHGTKTPGSELTDLQRKFCLNYIKQGGCNATGALEAAGSRANYASRRAAASTLLTKINIKAEIRRLNAKADKKARNREDHVLVSVAERKAILSAIIRANPSDLRGISCENGALVFEDEACREAVIAGAQVVSVPDPNNPGKRTQAILINLSMYDRIRAIQELNRMEGVYKETNTQPVEIHFHGDVAAELDAQTAAQLEDSAMRVPIPGTQADLARYRKPVTSDPFAALKAKSPAR